MAIEFIAVEGQTTQPLSKTFVDGLQKEFAAVGVLRSIKRFLVLKLWGRRNRPLFFVLQQILYKVNSHENRQHRFYIWTGEPRSYSFNLTASLYNLNIEHHYKMKFYKINITTII